MIDLEIGCLTRQQLADYSTFTLPPAARPLVGRKSLRVPPLTLERIRTLERHGAFDAQHTKATMPKRLPERERPVRTIGGAPDPNVAVDHFVAQQTRAYFVPYRARRQGDTRLYNGWDLIVARFAAWMLHVGSPMHQLPLLLRGDYPVLSCIRARDADFALMYQVSDRHARRIVMGTAQEMAHLQVALPEGSASWVFPIIWLRRSGFAPKVRKALTTPVERWRQEWTPRELVARQGREIEPAPLVTRLTRKRKGLELRT